LLKVAINSNRSLKDKTLGIIGVGNVGSKVQKFALTIGMNVLLNDPPRERLEGKNTFHPLNTILSESDIVSIHVPLNLAGEDFTFHLFDDEKFLRMKKGSWFFNTSRGEVVDTAALKKNLNLGKPVGAIIDVWENEPDIDTEFMSQVFIATPHIAGYSTDGKANGTAMVVNSLSKYFNLPTTNWYPGNLPLPVFPCILIYCKDKSDEEILNEAIRHTYDLEEDNERLRHKPSDFEKLRGDYPLRREFTSYTATLKSGTEKNRQMLENIGFKIKV
jgi:erythronate-4-phosphate dehydrogenase